MEKINVKQLAKEIISANDVSQFSDSELDNLVEKAKLKIDKEYEKPITLLSMIETDKTSNELVNLDVLTTGNISATIGAAKSKKTFFSTILMSSLLGYKDFAINGDLQGLNILFFDTEQSHYHVQMIHKRITRLFGERMNNMEIFVLRPFGTEERLAIIEYYLKKNQGNYSFVIIDGIVDLIYDFNDLKESTIIVNKIMAWSAIYNCHINAILHTNKDKAHARGHLGTALTNKSETVFKIEKEDNSTSNVGCEYSRNKSFDKWSFCIEKGLPKRTLLPNGFYNSESDIKETDDLPF